MLVSLAELGFPIRVVRHLIELSPLGSGLETIRWG